MSTAVDERAVDEVPDPLEPGQEQPENDELPAEPVDDDEPESGPGDQAEPEAEQSTDKAMEAALKKLDKEATRHANAVSSIMGEDAQLLVRCELCETNIPGFHWPDVHPDDPRRPLFELLALGGPPAFQDAPDAETCETCVGLGLVKTGSRNPEHVTKLCPTCRGLGWIDKAAPLPVGPNPTHLAAPAIAAVPPATDLADQDFLGRPRGHEFYGRLPAYMTPEEIARDVPGAHP